MFVPPPPPGDYRGGGNPNGNRGGGSWGGPSGGGPYDGSGGDILTGPPAPSAVNSVRDVRERVTLNAVPTGTILPVILGRGRVEGRVIHVIEGNPEILIVAFAAGPNNAIEAHYFNGQQITSGSDGVTIAEHLGAYAQSVDTTVQTYIGNYTLPGLTYAVYSIDGGDSFSEPSPFFGQVTSIVADIKGIELYDPRENRITRSEVFSSSYWTCSGTFPTVATGIADRFNGTAASRWTFGASGPYTIYHDTSGLSLATSDPVTVAIDVRASTPFTCNLTAKKTSGSSTATAISVGTAWRRYTVTHPAGTGTGNARLQLDGIPPSSVIEVAFASVQVLAEDFGYTKTVTTAVTQGTRWADNPVLAMLYLENDEVNGAGGTPTASVNMASWGKAAALCDGIQEDGTATYSIGYVISTEGNASQYREAIRGTCAAEVYWEDGKLCCWVDSYQPTDPVLAFDTATNAKDPSFWLTAAPDRPTHVVVKFNDSSKDYSASSAQADHPLLKAGTVKYQEAVYHYDAIVSEHVANRVARYTEGRARLCEGNASFTVPFVGVRLTRGMLVSLTTEDGLSAQPLIVDDFTLLDSGEYSVTGHEYDTALYTFDPLTADTPPSTTLVDPRTAPPDVLRPSLVAGPPTGLYWEAPRLYDAVTLYGAAAWSQVNITSWSATAINDGSDVGSAGTYGPSSLSRIILDATTAKKFGKLRFAVTAGSAFEDFSSYWLGDTPTVQYSDDASAWTSVANPKSSLLRTSTDFTGWVVEWDVPAAAHRYWRITIGLGAAGATVTVREAQFYTVNRVYPYVSHYEVHAGTSATAPLLATVLPPIPLSTTPLSVEGAWYMTNVPYTGAGTLLHEIVRYLDLTIVTVNTLGVKSAGVYLFRVGAPTSVSPSSNTNSLLANYPNFSAGTPATSSTARAIAHGGVWKVSENSGAYAPVITDGGATPGVKLQASTPGTAQTGNANLTGKVKAGQVEADPQAAGTVALEVDNVTSPTVALAEFKLNNVVQLDVDKRGSLRTKESSRVAPWVEARVACSTLTTITSTTAADITGATITFTPPSDVRALITTAWDVDVSTVGDSFIGELVVNGTPETPQAFLKLLTTNERVLASQVYAIILTGGTSYTIKLTGKLNASGATYHVNSTNTGFVILGIGRF